MSPNVRIQLYEAQARAWLAAPSGPVAQDIYRRGKRVEAAAKRTAPVDTGRLRSSLTTNMVFVTGVPVARVGSNVSYLMFLTRGTGIYGPARRPIRPVRATRLVFRPRGARGYVFARQVRGVRPNPFMLNALQAARS